MKNKHQRLAHDSASNQENINAKSVANPTPEQLAITYLTLQQFNEKHPAFKMGTLRHCVFYEESNGLKDAGAIVRFGRRVLINETKWFEWLAAQNGRAA